MGQLNVPDKPGIGVDVNLKDLEKVTVKWKFLSKLNSKNLRGFQTSKDMICKNKSIN